MRKSSKNKTAPPSSQRLAVDANYKINYPHVDLANGGTVVFVVAPQNGCLIYTDPPLAFVGESGGYVPLKHGSNQALKAAVQDTTITYCPCAVGQKCDPFNPSKSGGNTIKVGSD